MFKKIKDYLSIEKRKYLYKKNSYSFNGVDLLIAYLFKDFKKGVYVDIGAQHPVSNNNTFLLFKKGWKGANVDLDKENINLFNISRPQDFNLNYAISSKKGKKKLFFYHNKSPINTLDEKVSMYQKAKVNKVKEIDVITLDDVLSFTDIKKINFLNIDVEGHELDVLKGFDFAKYRPEVINVEFLDLKMKKLELRNNDLNSILNSELYKYIASKNYHFVNWIHGDLIFVSNNFRD